MPVLELRVHREEGFHLSLDHLLQHPSREVARLLCTGSDLSMSGRPPCLCCG
jgi:hypothetical protein